jgi:predicted dehydrogenase
MSTPVTFALLGAGGIAHAWSHAFAEVPLAEPAGVYDPLSGVAESLAEELHCATYPSQEAVLADPQVEAIIICSPNPFHAPQTSAAAAAHKHVLTEKPMALTVADCDAMIAACAQAGVQLMVGQALRFYQPFDEALRMAGAGELGRVLGVDLIRMGSPGPQEHPITWRDDEAQTGGWLLELNVHEIDFLQTLLGVPESVYAARSNLLKPATASGYDLLNVVAHCPEGRQGHLLAGEVAQGQGMTRYVVFGEEATISWDAWAPKLTITRPGTPGTDTREWKPKYSPMGAQLEGFRAALRGEGPLPVTGEEGKAAIATCARIRKSWETGQAA